MPIFCEHKFKHVRHREDRLVTGLLEEANAKVRDLEASLSEAKKQLKIQTQVIIYPNSGR